MLTNIPLNFSNPNPPKSSRILNTNANMLLDVIETPIVETHKRMGILFQACTMYKWINNQCVLSIVVILFATMLVKVVIANVAFVAFNNTPCMTT